MSGQPPEPSSTEAPPPLPPWIKPAPQFIAEATDPPPALVEGVLSGGSKTLICGQTNSGKTLFVLELLRAMLTLAPAFGTCAARKARCLLVEEEHHEGNLSKRLRSFGLNSLDLLVAHRSQLVLPRDAKVKELEGLIQPWEVDVLVLDPLVNLHAADENSVKEMRGVLAALDGFQKIRPSLAIIVLHHTGKGDQGASLSAVRGSSALTGAFDDILLVAPNEDAEGISFIVHEVKRRDSERLAPKVYSVSFDTAGMARWTVEEKPSAQGRSTEDIEGAILELFRRDEQISSAKSLAKALHCKYERVLAALNAMIERGWVAKDGKVYRLLNPRVGLVPVPGTALERNRSGSSVVPTPLGVEPGTGTSSPGERP